VPEQERDAGKSADELLSLVQATPQQPKSREPLATSSLTSFLTVSLFKMDTELCESEFDLGDSRLTLTPESNL